jgi:hypothetical protein
MNPENPQSGKRGTRSGSRNTPGGTSGAGFDPVQQSQSGVDDLNTSAASSGAVAGNERAADFPATGESAGGAGRIVDQVKEKAAAQLHAQKQRATDGLGSVASAVRQTTERLRADQHDTVAAFVERAADQIERFSNHLRDRDLNELVDEAQRFARQQPAVFIGSSFAAGLLAARFIKASRPDYRDDRGYGSVGAGPAEGSSAAGERTYGSGFEPSSFERSTTSFGSGPAGSTGSSAFNTGTGRPDDDFSGRGSV